MKNWDAFFLQYSCNDAISKVLQACSQLLISTAMLIFFTVELVSINVRRSPSITTLTTQRDIFSLGRRQLIILCLHLNQADKQQTVATWPRQPSTQVSQN